MEGLCCFDFESEKAECPVARLLGVLQLIGSLSVVELFDVL